MENKIRLADIYIKIYNKRSLTMDDLTFLAKYDPECFAKTCQNLVYNIPETKELLKPEETKKEVKENLSEETEVPTGEPVVLKRESMEQILDNLRKMDMKELPIQEVKTEKVKNLLGSLYMEKLFPHNDREQYFNMEKEQEESKFNKKA
ncbi:hypothetical protein [Roseburia sp. MSJ-14]|uniref:hypothetical protein n=1 Tax=Roseburia sp. MSJ-14 TaxID=2841514 RepID=UPI001C125C15|nr:hypothetical protein [Roseburia sp. MSJ-14]MBU5473837.1 hypothetical protein [Roseburia sp. MSJ-14]